MIGRLRAELEAVSTRVDKAQERESQRVSELERHRTEHQPEPPEKADARPSKPRAVRWQHGARLVAVLTAVVLIVILLLFVLPPLDATL